MCRDLGKAGLHLDRQVCCLMGKALFVCLLAAEWQARCLAGRGVKVCATAAEQRRLHLHRQVCCELGRARLRRDRQVWKVLGWAPSSWAGVLQLEKAVLVGPSAVEREARCLAGRGVKCLLSLLGNAVSIFMGRRVVGWGGLCLFVYWLLSGRRAVWRGGG